MFFSSKHFLQTKAFITRSFLLLRFVLIRQHTNSRPTSSGLLDMHTSVFDKVTQAKILLNTLPMISVYKFFKHAICK